MLAYFDLQLNLYVVMDTADNHQLMFDRTISPLMQTNQSMTGFRASAWSPLGADSLGWQVSSCPPALHCVHTLVGGYWGFSFENITFIVSTGIIG